MHRASETWLDAREAKREGRLLSADRRRPPPAVRRECVMMGCLPADGRFAQCFFLVGFLVLEAHGAPGRAEMACRMSQAHVGVVGSIRSQVQQAGEDPRARTRFRFCLTLRLVRMVMGSRAIRFDSDSEKKARDSEKGARTEFERVAVTCTSRIH